MSFFDHNPNEEPQLPPTPPEIEIKGGQATLKNPVEGSEKRVQLPKTAWGLH